MILGAKIYVDFSKYSFDESINRLKKEINQSLSIKNVLNDAITKNQKSEMLSQQTSLSEWNKEMINNWLLENDIDSLIQAKLKNFNGEMLLELNELKKSAPDYFYNSFSSHVKPELESLIKFTCCLKKLLKLHEKN